MRHDGCSGFGILQAMEVITLPTGTRLKHGTSATQLRSIIASGLLPGHSRHDLRDLTEERPKASAVYVGGLAAYFGAWAAASAVIKEYELAEPSFSAIAQSGDPSLLRRSTYSPPPFALPVVLTIECAEDVPFIGDEDYALWREGPDGVVTPHPESTTKNIWEKYRSGGVTRDKGIPSSWIKKIEYPQLLRLGSETDSQHRRLGPDCHLLAAAVYQNHALAAAEEVQIGPKRWSESVCLSQQSEFSAAGVEQLFSLQALADAANRLHNMIVQYQYVSHIGSEAYGLKFA